MSGPRNGREGDGGARPLSPRGVTSAGGAGAATVWARCSGGCPLCTPLIRAPWVPRAECPRPGSATELPLCRELELTKVTYPTVHAFPWTSALARLPRTPEFPAGDRHQAESVWGCVGGPLPGASHSALLQNPLGTGLSPGCHQGQTGGRSGWQRVRGVRTLTCDVLPPGRGGSRQVAVLVCVGEPEACEGLGWDPAENTLGAYLLLYFLPTWNSHYIKLTIKGEQFRGI